MFTVGNMIVLPNRPVAGIVAVGEIAQSGGTLTDFNGRTANIIAVDIKASNGVIHVIDRVVLP